MPKKPSRLPHRTNSERLSTAVTRSFTMSGMTGFLIAVGGFSLICFWLMTRTQNIGARRSSYDGSGSDSSSYSGSSSGTGWSLSSWFGGDSSSSHNSGSSSDSGGGGGGGGGDGGGGGSGD
jgi:hypothetical protein